MNSQPVVSNRCTESLLCTRHSPCSEGVNSQVEEVHRQGHLNGRCYCRDKPGMGGSAREGYLTQPGDMEVSVLEEDRSKLKDVQELVK